MIEHPASCTADALSVTTMRLPAGQTGHPYTAALVATAATPPYTRELPADLTLHSGEPPQPGTYEAHRDEWIRTGDLGALAKMTDVLLPDQPTG